MFNDQQPIYFTQNPCTPAAIALCTVHTQQSYAWRRKHAQCHVTFLRGERPLSSLSMTSGCIHLLQKLTIGKGFIRENKETRKLSPHLLLYPPQTKFGGVYRNHPVCLSVCLSVRLSRVNLTLVITFHPIEIRLSYYTCWFLVTRSFFSYQKFWPCDLDLDFSPNFEKNLTLAITFEPREIRLSYYRYVFLVARPFIPYQKFWPCDLDLDFWPTFEKI